MTDNTSDLRGAYAPSEFQRAYALSKSTFYELIKSGRLRAVKCGRRTLITRADAEAWLAALPVLHTATPTT